MDITDETNTHSKPNLTIAIGNEEMKTIEND